MAKKSRANRSNIGMNFGTSNTVINAVSMRRGAPQLAEKSTF
ncbi:hypothetical protein [Cypionkella sp.]|nr:hypothetical protein [Cypionkella sp.]